MRVIIQSAIIFTEILVAGCELTAGFFLLNSFLKRRQRHLLHFAVFFILAGLGATGVILGDAANLRGETDTAQTLTALWTVLTTVGMFFYLQAFFNIFEKNRGKRLLLAAVSASVLVAALIIGSDEVGRHLGTLIPSSTLLGFARSWFYYVIGTVVTTAIAVVAYYRRRHDTATSKPHKLLALGGVVILLTTIYMCTILVLDFGQGVIFMNILLCSSVVLRFFGGMTIEHPDSNVIKKPSLILMRRLSLKVVLISMGTFASLSFLLIAVTSQYFVDRALIEQEVRIQQTLNGIAKEFGLRAHMTQVKAEYVAAKVADTSVFVGDKKPLSELRLTAHDGRANGHIIDLVYANGLVVTDGDIASGTDKLNESAAVASALQGTPNVSIEHDDDIIGWVIRAATPVTDAKGQLMGVAVVTAPLNQVSFPTCESSSGLKVSGCGLVMSDGQVAYSVGKEVDGRTAQVFQASLRGTQEGSGQFGHIRKFFVARPFIWAENTGGFLYAFSTDEDIDGGVHRLLLTVTLLAALFLVLTTMLFLFGLGLILHPIRLLQGASERASRGDYGQAIEFDSPDEMGLTIATFNRMTATIRARTDSLQEKVREQHDAISHMSREIRVPLNIFRWSLEMLRFGDVGALNNEQMELVEQMNQTNERMRKLVGNLMEAVRIDAGRVDLVKEPLQIEDIIDEVAGQFSVRIRERQIDFYWRRPEKPLPLVVGDKDILSRVLMNLITNAIKFNRDGGRIEVTATIVDGSGAGETAGQSVRVTIADNGRGIPKAEQDKIFRRFYRASNVVAEEMEGTGLGLFLSKQFIEMHRGKIWFESKENEGTSFHFSLPVS